MRLRVVILRNKFLKNKNYNELKCTEGGNGCRAWQEVLCKNFQAGEDCQYGDSCHFAHGEEELRTGGQSGGPNAPGFKELMCKHYLGKGSLYLDVWVTCNFATTVASPPDTGRESSRLITGLISRVQFQYPVVL